MSNNFLQSLLNPKRFVFFAAIFVLFYSTALACEEKEPESRWIEQTIRLWENIRRDALLLPAEKLPWMILFDESCVWQINPDLAVLKTDAKNKIAFNPKLADVYLTGHTGKIALPSGEEIPAQLVSFASGYGENKKPFFVASMPAIWQKAPNLRDEKNLDKLIRSVFVHEMTHTLHRNFYAKLDEIEKKIPDVKDFNDDIIQNIFGEKSEFRRGYELERDLLYEAVEERTVARRRQLANTVLDSIRTRRKQFFTGKDAIYAEAEEIFLTMEGAANWAAYRAAIAQGLNEPDALRLIRRSGKHWSQDEGLAIFAVIDSLLPQWQKKAFGKRAATVTELLSEAVR